MWFVMIKCHQYNVKTCDPPHPSYGVWVGGGGGWKYQKKNYPCTVFTKISTFCICIQNFT